VGKQDGSASTNQTNDDLDVLKAKENNNKAIGQNRRKSSLWE